MSPSTPKEDFADACDVFKRYHTYHATPKFPLGQMVRVNRYAGTEEIAPAYGRVVGYFSSKQYPAGLVVDSPDDDIMACHPYELEALGV